MKVYFVGYIGAFVALAILDALWLGAMSRDFYKARLGQLLLEQPNWYAAILFYLVHALGIVVFAVPLAGSWVSAALFGEPRRSRLGRRRDGSRHRGGFPGDARRLKDQCSSSYSG